MAEETRTARLVARRLLVVPDVRKGILRKPGMLVITRQRLIFVPESDSTDEVLDALLQCTEDGDMGERIRAVADAAAGHAEGFLIDRRRPGLSPPDVDGRLRLLDVGLDDDLLVPPDDVALVALMMGPPHRGEPQSGPPTVSSLLSQDDRPQRPGWWGPISTGVAAILGVGATPFLALMSILVAEEMDDELGSLLFLLGSAVLLVAHLATFGSAGFAFYRRESSCIWGLGTIPFAILSGLIIMFGAVFALDELM